MGSSELSNSLTFPIKLRKIVDATETDHLIHWSEDGNSFHITDENQFARDIIPNYFKHSNISSFIRQLNMYGFHKVNRIDNGLSIIGTGNDDSQWVHPNFIRDKPEILPGVLRKVTNSTFNNSIITPKSAPSNEMVPFDSVKTDINQLAKMVQYLRKRDEETTQQLKSLQIENDELYTELMFLREQHDKQSKCIDMLIEFFSQYAKTPITSRLKTKRNILALECTQPRNLNLPNGRNTNEPPRKFQATSTDSASINSNNMFKGKKVIKISNVNQPSHFDVKTPKIINNNGLYHLSTTMNNKPQKVPVIYTLSLPKNVNNITKPPLRAITASNTSSVISKTNNSSCNPPYSLNSIPFTKTVTVTGVKNNSPPSYNDQYFERLPEDNNSNNNIHSNHQQFSSNINNPNVSAQNIVSGISSNVNDMEQCLSDFQEIFNSEQPFENMNFFNPESFNDASLDDDWKMLLENIKSDNSLQELDPGRIHGHELIPFSGNQGEAEVNNESLYSYSIDDLLQTPNIQPGMSSLTLDTMDVSDYNSVSYNVKKH